MHRIAWALSLLVSAFILNANILAQSEESGGGNKIVVTNSDTFIEYSDGTRARIYSGYLEFPRKS